ncbi:MmpS family transport accessory protein [Streptomyces gardneri]|uniref:MmpS family transport accessory protein n=1 Tax=Streptomyces gardneri TaxID=66892 RepID=UPI0036C4BC0C
MPTPDEPKRRIDRSDRGGAAVAAVLLLLCGAFVVYGFLNTDTEDEAAGKRAATPTAVATYEVTYEVLGEGAADVTYRGAGDEAHVVTRVGLPWRKTVSVPLGASPIVNVTLGEKGGTASCTLAVRGKHVQRATAGGAFGRTTCGGEAPTAEASAAPQ